MPRSRANQVNALGRPSSYDSKYCQVVVELGKKGKSPAQIASAIEIPRGTLLNWIRDHEDFATAMALAKTHEQAFWEEMGYVGLTAKQFNAAIWQTSMKSRFRHDYSDRVEHVGSDGEPLISAPEQIARALALLMAEAKARQIEPPVVIEGLATKGE